MPEAARWYTPPELWKKLKPLAKEQRHGPTTAEAGLWQQLRAKRLDGHKFRRQHPIERFIVDFYCARAKLAIEIDGPVHRYSQPEDQTRQEFLEMQGIRVIRFTNQQVEKEPERVLEQIRATLAHLSPRPPLR